MTELQQLLQRLDNLAAAIERLVQVNQVLIMAMAESDGDTDPEPLTYMDGTPRQ